MLLVCITLPQFLIRICNIVIFTNYVSFNSHCCTVLKLTQISTQKLCTLNKRLLYFNSITSQMLLVCITLPQFLIRICNIVIFTNYVSFNSHCCTVLKLTQISTQKLCTLNKRLLYFNSITSQMLLVCITLPQFLIRIYNIVIFTNYVSFNSHCCTVLKLTQIST